MHAFFARVLDQLILERPLAILLVVALVSAYFISYAPSIDLDASAESLLLEDDVELRYLPRHRCPLRLDELSGDYLYGR